jgi:hypothetical protein
MDSVSTEFAIIEPERDSGASPTVEKYYLFIIPTLVVVRPWVAPIPEPGTWGLLLLGSWGVGAMLRGRRRCLSANATP